MILVCPSCHRSYVFDDAEIASKGGPAAYKCDECSHALATMADAMGIKLQDNDTAQADPGMTMDGSAGMVLDPAVGSFGGDDGPTELRPAFNGDESGAHLSDGESTAPQVPAIDLPPGQLVVGGGSQNTDHNIQAPAAERPRLSTRITGAHNVLVPPPGSVKPTLPMDNDPRHAATVASQPAMHRPSPQPSRPPATKGVAGPTAFLAVGCLLFVALLALVGVGGAVLYLITGVADDGSTGGGDGGTVAARPPLEDRMREAASAVPNTAVPTVPLRTEPQDGEVIFVAPTAVTYGNETLATVSMGRVAVGAKPNPESPLVIPLARTLEAAFAKEFSDPMDAENAIRWVVVLVDGKVSYRTVYEVLYTCWERGARMQLATTNPTNPNSYVAIEVLAEKWPNPDHVGTPDDLPRRSSLANERGGGTALTVKITDRGFLLWGPGEKEREAVRLHRVTAYPVSQLQKYSAALRRDPRIRAMRVITGEDTNIFVVLQAIAAVNNAKSGSTQQMEVLLAPPAGGK